MPPPVIASFLSFLGAVFSMEEDQAGSALIDASSLEEKDGFAPRCSCGAEAVANEWLDYVFCPQCKKALSEKGTSWEAT